MNGHTIIFALLLAAAFLRSELALAFPDNARHGYASSCLACHASPSGGGALHDYGRLTSAAFLSTWGTEAIARPLYGLPLSSSDVSMGGDQRLIRVVGIRPDEPATFRTIPMQYDLELAVNPIPAITVAATWGVYGPELEEGSRRHYILARLGEHLTARAGRFFPAYGITGPDHTTYARQALHFDEGQETVNGEMAIHSDLGDVFATAIYGQSAIFGAQEKKGYYADSKDETGVAFRVQANIGKASYLGASALSLESYEKARRAVGAHIFVTFTSWLWAQGEVNRLVTEDDYTASGRLTVEPLRGVQCSLEGEAMSERRRAGISLQWFPIPHWGLEALGRREITAERETYTAVFMGHHYL